MTRKILIALGVIVTGFLTGLIIARMIPTTTPVEVTACLRVDDGDCLHLPTITGANLNGTTRTFPAELDKLTLVVMPFDRDQQVNAATWIPYFQQLSARYAVNYASFAALPALSPTVRALVSVGLNAAVSAPEVRERTYIFYLEDQATFLEALNLTDTTQPWLFIIGPDGTIHYASSGDFSNEGASALREALEGQF